MSDEGLLVNSLRDELRGLRSDVEDLRRRIPSALFSTYTPTLTATVTNPTLGAGAVQEGLWTRLGDIVIVHSAIIRFGTAGESAGAGFYKVSLPVAASPLPWATPIGLADVEEWGVGGATWACKIGAAPYNYISIIDTGAFSEVSATVPHAWGANDYIRVGSLAYRAAA